MYNVVYICSLRCSRLSLLESFYALPFFWFFPLFYDLESFLFPKPSFFGKSAGLNVRAAFGFGGLGLLILFYSLYILCVKLADVINRLMSIRFFGLYCALNRPDTVLLGGTVPHKLSFFFVFLETNECSSFYERLLLLIFPHDAFVIFLVS